jgi:dTDP-4-amino-4,6-dideoxygalactose transaminase
MSMISYTDLAGEHRESEEPLLEAVAGVLHSGNFILGSAVEEFEAQFAALHGLSDAVGVASGLDALTLTLEALGIGNGDEVITAPNSFIATAAAIALAGARPVFVEVDDDQTMSPEDLLRAVNPRTKAIIPVHLNGRPAPMRPIMEIAGKAGIPVIEDCAQAVGASLDGIPVGTFGAAGCYSFHPLKNLNACGDGGAIVTSDKTLAKRLRLLRNHGLQDRDTCLEWGHNSRLDTIQAAILLEKLKHLNSRTELRRRNASFYLNNLKDLPIRLPNERDGEYCVWQAFVIQSPCRDELRSFLRKKGIEALIHYPVPIHLQPAAKYLNYPPGSFPVCEAQAECILSIPVRQSLGIEEIEMVAAAINEFFVIFK